jgi:nucleotidyltransferase/DNA polymerase involved in DNA repair
MVHGDLDASCGSIEQLDNPELKGDPVVVPRGKAGRRALMRLCHP